ncbi:hypothetical protein EA462_04510 [Natrarchaeobius halalkaliphilus]|uniref:Right-handed parallel beta-helix repeat-containing protein n=1 Tax=Natrarchaeobius halalkaliphilus TaxID=1679091 RepID=A0A3N6LPA4_9EURY|nr:hypothetical protein [Natrarchaeobius halalkaliphilus]RQG91258.1 hypothetical protein EA462_04510 [Natrarchaeobius halalkaliphilus]
MAREPSVLDDERPVCDGGDAAERSGNTGLLGRRSYMKLAGTTTAAAAVSGLASADGDGYEEIAANGQVIRIGRGETYENKLFDLTTGDSVLLLVEGGDSVIRNIGFRGLHRGDAFMISITASSGDVLIENVYLGDGSTKEGESFVHGPGAVFYHRNASCDVTFRYCNVQGWPNNGFYCSNTANGGSARFEHCYGKNNGVSTYRIAGGNDAIVGSVAYNDDTDYGPGWGGYVEDAGRPVWVWPGGTPSLEDSHFASGGYPYAMVLRGDGSARMTGGGIRGTVQGEGLQRSDVSRTPDLSVPDGVPTSAEEAAAGGSVEPESGDGTGETEPESDESTLSNVILFDGDPDDATRYEFEADGRVEKSTHDGASIDDEDVVDDGFVHGVVADWKDAFRFSGELEQLTVDGPATVSVNGVAVDPDEYGEELPHVLTVEGGDEPTSYEITVDGAIELDSEDDPIDEVTIVSGSAVQSSVTETTQTFRFSGAVTDVSVSDGDAVVSIDGAEIDPDEYGDNELLPHALLIDATGTEGPSTYSVEVSDVIVKSDFRTVSVDDSSVSRGRTVRDIVENGRSTYWFDGEIENFRLLGRARADVQYNARGQ